MTAHKLRTVLIVCALTILCFITYSNSLHNQFMIDDWDLFFNKSRIPDPKHLGDIFDLNSSRSVFFRPVSTLFRSYLIAFIEPDFYYYRIINVLLFSAHIILTFFIFKKLLKRSLVPFTVALLCAVHPLNSIVINYISAHEVILYGIFLDLSALLLLFYLDDTRKKALLYLSLLGYIFALFTQEITFAFPLVATLLCLYSGKDTSVISSFRTCKLFFITGALYLTFRLTLIGHTTYCINRSMYYADSAGINALSYLNTTIKLFLWYLQKLIYPSEIVFMKTLPPQSSDILLTLSASLAVIAIAFFLWRTLKERSIALALLWFSSGFILPFGLSFIYPYQGFTIEPHWFFLSSTGFFLLIALLLNRALLSSPDLLPRATGFILILGLALSGFTMTRTYNEIWKDQKTYCSYWVSIAPDFFFPNLWLAKSFQQEGRFEKAEFYFKRSLTGHYTDSHAYECLGEIESARKNTTKAALYHAQAKASMLKKYQRQENQ